MPDQPIADGWWQAADGRWYPPEQGTGPNGASPPGRPSMAAGVPPSQHVGTFTPSLRTMLPVGWFAKETITLLAPDGQANVIASSEPLDPTIDSTQYATIQGELIRKEFPGFTEHSFGPMALFGDQSGYERRFSWTPPDGVRVHQIQIYFSQAGRGYTATATTPATQLDRYEADFEAILGALRFQSDGGA